MKKISGFLVKEPQHVLFLLHYSPVKANHMRSRILHLKTGFLSFCFTSLINFLFGCFTRSPVLPGTLIFSPFILIPVHFVLYLGTILLEDVFFSPLILLLGKKKEHANEESHTIQDLPPLFLQV